MNVPWWITEELGPVIYCGAVGLVSRDPGAVAKTRQAMHLPDETSTLTGDAMHAGPGEIRLKGKIYEHLDGTVFLRTTEMTADSGFGGITYWVVSQDGEGFKLTRSQHRKGYIPPHLSQVPLVIWRLESGSIQQFPRGWR